MADDPNRFSCYKNFSRRSRRGLELGGSTRLGALSLAVATPGSGPIRPRRRSVAPATAPSEEASLEGRPDQRPGNRIPLIPEHLLKASANYRVNSALTVEPT